MARSASLLAALGATVLLGGVLAGCASTGGASSPEDSSAGPITTEVDAAWLDGGRLIGLVTLGSSTCVPGATDVSLKGNVIHVTLDDPDEATACTSDLVPRVSLVAVPEGVDPTGDVSIAVTGAYTGDTELAGAAGLAAGGTTDNLPTAGWTDANGQFVLLTWGSSTCKPVVEDVAPTASAEVTVTFQTPAENTVCTMDMVPRAQVITVDGLEADENVSLVLNGDSFDKVQIPIYGVN